MSQLRNIGLKLRPAIAIVAVWALMFSVAMSSAATVSATDVVAKSNGAVSGGLFACFKRHMTQRADAASDKAAPEGNPTSGKHHCPCCLAAASVAAVLPARAAAGAAAFPAPKPVFYVVENSDAPKNVSSRSAHGARAPPARA
ncbi:DUF2946 family protein [Methylocystis sp. JAN1]|uniref:DUF2946 family protein n=1 Tax=Methylocystis sp. JAN1 TaxID=3397211 RepID=UPI003FA2230F